jgi:hypothetical protein
VRRCADAFLKLTRGHPIIVLLVCQTDEWRSAGDDPQHPPPARRSLSEGRCPRKTSNFSRYIAPEFLQYLSEDEIREGQNNERLIEKEFKNENLYCL